MFHWGRERRDEGSVWRKILLVVGIVGLGIGAGLLRRRVKIRVPRAEAAIGRGRARARLHVQVSRRRGTLRGRRRARRGSIVRRAGLTIS